MAGYILLAIGALVIFGFLFVYGGVRELIGRALLKLFPRHNTQKGDRVDIFLNGKYNRTATVTKVCPDKLYIYNTLPLPLDYRGSFYAQGIDTNDGSKLIYIGTRKHYRFIKMAELIRKAFAVMDDYYNLEPTDYEKIQEPGDAQEESEVGDES